VGRRQRLELLQCGNTSGAVSADLDDAVGRRHLQDQVSIVDDDHELVRGQPTNDDIQGEVHLRNIKDDALCVVVLKHPECDRQGDTTMWNDVARVHTQK
jgi:hypothetical protein